MSENQKQTTKSIANAVGATCGRPQDHRGITLVALIITIIVMLILVGVSIAIAINGGLFTTAKKGAKDTQKEIDAEQELSNGRMKIDGIWYDSLEDYAIGRQSTVQGIPDLNESNTIFTYNPSGWTNEAAKVTINATALTSGYKLKYSTDGINWSDYTTGTEIPINENEAVHVKLVDNAGNEGGSATGNALIDKQSPTIDTALNSPSQMTTGINLSVGVTDSVSGISKIEWNYKENTATDYTTITDEYVTINGNTAGEKTAVKTKALSGLTKDTTYNIYAVIYDVAGNSTRTPEGTGTINIKTMDSLLGKSATINGEKYIVLYEPGEKIQIDGTDYEIQDVQLVSANVLEPDNVWLGYRDGQVNWTNANVITEADRDNDGTLDNVEKAIYSYNHAVETLNKKCESLVDISNPDIISVRSVGSNPINPNSENTTLYTSEFLQNNPISEPGKYNGIGKNTDENYLTDFTRMRYLGIQKSENIKGYWLDSRNISIYNEEPAFCVRLVNDTGVCVQQNIWYVDSTGGWEARRKKRYKASYKYKFDFY